MHPAHPNRSEVGRIGEGIAARYLEGRGYRVIGRNYRKKWGELDLIAQKGSKIHFVEVKTVTRGTEPKVSRETYRPEDNVHPQKLKRIYRAIESYLSEKDMSQEWVIDVVTVELDRAKRIGRCRLIENVF